MFVVVGERDLARVAQRPNSNSFSRGSWWCLYCQIRVDGLLGQAVLQLEG